MNNDTNKNYTLNNCSFIFYFNILLFKIYYNKEVMA